MVHLRLRRIAALLLMLLVSAGCYRGRVTDAAPHAVVETQQPRQVRVTTSDRQRAALVGPRVAGDSALGWTPGHAPRRARFALADVTRIAAGIALSS